jgi:thioredoxin-like negative regulator of GroEL
METASFLIWVLFIGAIATIGIGSMARAYVGKGSFSIVFSEPIALPAALPALDPEAATQFQQGCEAFLSRNYRQASDRLNAAMQQEPAFAEAHHNRGRAIANLRQDNEAAALLVKAGDLYLQQENAIGYEQVKQDLQTLKTSRSKQNELARDKAS